MWTVCHLHGGTYTATVPKLWDQTIETHRQAVRDAALDAAAALIAERGLRAVTMSQIADVTGIARATLYKHFPDIEAVLLAWHERVIARHLQILEDVREAAGSPVERLKAVLEAYALIAHDSHGRHDADLAGVLHRDEHVARGEHHLRELLGRVLVDAAADGEVRDDVAPAELANYCLHAITAASSLPTKAAVHRLVDVTLSGLRPRS